MKLALLLILSSTTCNLFFKSRRILPETVDPDQQANLKNQVVRNFKREAFLTGILTVEPGPDTKFYVQLPEKWSLDITDAQEIGFDYIFPDQTKKKLVFVSLYEPETNTDDNSTLLCFEIHSLFSSATYNFFQCEPLEDENPSLDNIFNSLGKEITKFFDSISERMTNQITPEDIIDFVSNIKSNPPAKYNLPDWSIQFDGNQAIPVEARQYRAEDGAIAWFHFTKFEFIKFKIRAYRASADYLRVTFSSATRELELYVARFPSPKTGSLDGGLTSGGKASEIENEHGEEIYAFFASCLILAEDTKSQTVPEQLKMFENQPVSFPSAIAIFEQVLTSQERFLRLKETPEEAKTTPFELYDSKDFFFLTENDKANIKSLGSMFPDKLKDVSSSQVETTDLKVLAEQISNLEKNVYEAGFGDPMTKRKVFMRLFDFEEEFFKSILVKFVHQFFTSEFIIPYSDFNSFYMMVQEVAKEVVRHAQLYVLRSNDITLKATPVDLKNVREFIVTGLAKMQFSTCKSIDNIDNPDKADVLLEFRSSRERPNPGVANQVGSCSPNHGRVFIRIRKTKIEGRPGYVLDISEPYVVFQPSKRTLTSSYKFFQAYPYDYIDIIKGYLGSVMSHFAEGKFSKSELHEDKFKTIFETIPED